MVDMELELVHDMDMGKCPLSRSRAACHLRGEAWRMMGVEECLTAGRDLAGCCGCGRRG